MSQIFSEHLYHISMFSENTYDKINIIKTIQYLHRVGKYNYFLVMKVKHPKNHTEVFVRYIEPTTLDETIFPNQVIVESEYYFQLPYGLQIKHLKKCGENHVMEEFGDSESLIKYD